jgi:hypothetical protein
VPNPVRIVDLAAGQLFLLAGRGFGPILEAEPYLRKKSAMSTTKEIQKLDYVKGGVRYTIHVEEAEGGVKWGTWHCHDCQVGGSAGKNSGTLDEAVDAAKSDLERHHTTNHNV